MRENMKQVINQGYLTGGVSQGKNKETEVTQKSKWWHFPKVTMTQVIYWKWPSNSKSDNWGNTLRNFLIEGKNKRA